MNSFWMRLLALSLTVSSLVFYQFAMERHANEEAIAALEIRLEEQEREMAAAVQKAAAADVGLASDGLDSEGFYLDGVYVGEAPGYGGNIVTKITIEEGRISHIDVTDHAGEDAVYYGMAEEIIPTILAEQTAEVDTISGATFSSSGIRDAVAQALEGATR